MAIKISGCTVIDDSLNITNANNMCVGVVTITGSSGDIETPGTITAGGLDSPPSVLSFNPTDGATGVEQQPTIIIAFDQIIEKTTTGIGTTANITLRNSSGIGTVIQTIGVNSTSVAINGSVVTIDIPSQLDLDTNVYVVVDEAAFSNSSGTTSQLIDTYNFFTFGLGDAYEGGYLICKSSPVRWVVSPYSAEVSRNWFNQSDATTRASQVSGCSGWFVPTVAQLQNPGYICRSFWGPSPCYTAGIYWAPADYTTPFYTHGCYVNLANGSASSTNKNNTYCVRAFRCVTY